MTSKVASPLLVVFSLCWGVGEASSPGLAHSEAPFSVSRTARVLEGAGGTPFTLRNGDQVRAGEEFVRVNDAEGGTLLIDRNSSVRMDARDEIRLVDGALAVVLPADRKATVDVHDLRFSPVVSDGAAADSTAGLALSSVSPDEVEVLNMGRVVSVSSLPAGNQVAVLGTGDALRFARLSSGDWVPLAPRSQFSEDPTGDDTNSKKGVFGLLGRGGGAGAAAGGGGAAVAGGVGGAAIAGGVGVAVVKETETEDTQETTAPVSRAPSSGVEPPLDGGGGEENTGS